MYQNVPVAQLEAQLAQSGRLYLGAGNTIIERALRLRSGAVIAGAERDMTRLINQTAAQPWGDSATVQALQGHEFGIGYVDAFQREHGTGLAVLESLEAATHYPPGTICWTWPWTDTGVRVGPSTRHVVVTRDGAKLALDPLPKRASNAICWTRDSLALTRCTAGELSVVADLPAPTTLIGQVVLISDGMQVANEPRGKLRRVVAVRDRRVFLDRPLQRHDYKKGQCVLAPVNVIHGVTIRDMTIAAGPSGWSFYGKFLYGLRFERCRFTGTLEINQSAYVSLLDCHGAHLKLNCTHNVQVQGGTWQRVSLEECCADVTLAGVRSGQIVTDPHQACERIAVRDSLIAGVAADQSPIALEGRGCVIERVQIDCGRGSGHVYLTGADVGMLDVASSRGLVFRGGVRQYAQRCKAPGISLGWTEGGQSEGVAVALDTQQVTNMDGRWVIVN